MNLTKRCRVCGDEAMCFNFNGLSCEACKVFFRRNVIKEKDLECRNGNNCLVIMSTRKFCKRCRMDKCFAIGMKKELITIFKTKSAHEHIPKTISEYNQELQPYDMMRIHEIEVGMRHFPNEHTLPMVGKTHDMMHIIKLTEQYALRAIKYCKSIEAFRGLKSANQIQMMKTFYPEMSVTLMAFIYIEEKDGVRLMNETGQETIFAKVKIPEGYEAKNNFARALPKFALPLRYVMENDMTIRNLIISQLLFKPRDTIDNTEFLKYNYSVYCHLLRKYLRFKFKHSGDQKFISIMAVLGHIAETSKWCGNFFEQEMNQNDLPEILRDIYH